MGSDSVMQEYECRDFLERYSLPRVARVGGSEPVLLYRCFDSFTKVLARGVVGRKGKEKTDERILHFPEGYSGNFIVLESGRREISRYLNLIVKYNRVR